MTELFDKLDLLYLQPAVENRQLPKYEHTRRLVEIEMILDRIKLVAKVAKYKNVLSKLGAPYVVDQEGRC